MFFMEMIEINGDVWEEEEEMQEQDEEQDVDDDDDDDSDEVEIFRGETSEQKSGQEKSKAKDRVSFQIIIIVVSILDFIQYLFPNMNHHQGSIVYQDTGKVSTLPR